MRLMVAGLVMAALAGTAAAGPGDPFDTASSDEPPLTILEAPTQPCAIKNALCVAPGARSTIAVSATPEDKAADDKTADGKPADDKTGDAKSAKREREKEKPAPPPVRLSRAASVASSEGAATPPENAPWTIEVSGTLKRPAWAGNALFLFFDLEDPDALANRQFTALYQANIKASSKLTARIILSPDDGFRAGHAYRLRIVQLINGREIVLGETDLSLL